MRTFPNPKETILSKSDYEATSKHTSSMKDSFTIIDHRQAPPLKLEGTSRIQFEQRLAQTQQQSAQRQLLLAQRKLKRVQKDLDTTLADNRDLERQLNLIL